MKRIVFLLVVSLFALPATDSFAKTKLTKAKTKAQRLVDKQLDRITAGSTHVNEASDASGGAIVGNSSTASIKKTGNVELDGGAQQDARALNLVNAAESGVANGVNVWDGRLDSQTAETELNVNQENLILQNQARSASVPEYVRPEANVDETFNSTRDTTNTGSVNTLIAILGQEIRAGKGFAGAGSIGLDIDGGSIEVTNDLTRISDLAVVPYRQDQSLRLEFWGSDVRNHTTEGDTRWVNYNTSHSSSRSTAS